MYSEAGFPAGVLLRYYSVWYVILYILCATGFYLVSLSSSGDGDS